MSKQGGEKTRQLKLILALLVGIAFIAGYVTMIALTRGYHDHITTVQHDLLVQIGLERRVRDTAGILSELSDEYTLSKTYFKTPDDIISVIEEIEGLGGVVGAPVSVLQVEVENEDKDTREGTMIVNILSEGSWRSMSQLLGLLDSLPYQSQVMRTTLDTSGTDEDNLSPRWSLRATLEIELKTLEP